MTAISYTSDLTDIFMFETITGVAAWNITGGGGASLGAGGDYAVEGSFAVDKQISASEKGFMYQTTAWTIGTDDHHFIWINLAVYGLAATRDNRGICVCIGDDVSNYVQYHVNGSDTLPLGGMTPYAVEHDNTPLTNFRTLTGSPGVAPDNVGTTGNVTGTAKFSNLGADAARIGTGYDIVGGDTGGNGDFAGIASDDISTREGVFYGTQGGYLWQGKLRIGSAAALCEFTDSNTNLFVVDTLHAATTFTELLIEHASSVLTLTNVNFISLATTDGKQNLGRLEVITSAATLDFTNVGFIDFGVTIFGSGTTLAGCRWINTGTITPNANTITGGTISDNTSTTGALVLGVAADISSSTDIAFNNNNRAIEITTAGTYAFDGHQFTGNTVMVNFSGTGTCTINPSNGCNVTFAASETTGGGTLVVGAISTNFNFTVSPNPSPDYEWRLYTVTAIGSMTGAVEIDGAEFETTAAKTHSHTYTSQAVALQIISNDYKEVLKYYTLTGTQIDDTINLEIDDND